MSDLLKLIEARRSIRKFKDKPVPKEDMLKIIKAASMAPSGSNQQNWHFIVIADKATKEKMADAVRQAIKDLLSKVSSKKAQEEISSYSRYFTFFSQAPVVICAVEKPYDSLIGRLIEKYRPAYSREKSTSGIQGVAAAIENLLLAAAALGYGTCWMTGPLIAKKRLEKILKITLPDNLVALIPLGIADTAPAAPKRKPMEETVSFV